MYDVFKIRTFVHHEHILLIIVRIQLLWAVAQLLITFIPNVVTIQMWILDTTTITLFYMNVLRR